MSDNTKEKIETIDKIIIFIICFIFILAILGTIWWVKYKANKELKDIISNYNEIQYSTYKYNIENNKIHFYKDIKEVSVYKCIKDCVVENIQSEQFIFDKDDLIVIKDDSKYLIYNISSNKTILKLDEYPTSLSVKKYGIISKDNKYGIIDKSGKIINNFKFDKIESLDNYIFVIKENALIVYDNELKIITQKELEIDNLEDFVLLSNKNRITVVMTTKNSSVSTIYRFDKQTNKFVD